MKTEKEWEKAILNITMRIHQDFPEISKFIKEMPASDVVIKETEINVKNLEAYYVTLTELIEKYSETHPENKSDKSDIKGYPLYPENEDIYAKDKKEMKLNPEDLSKNKAPNEDKGTKNEKGFKDDKSGDDLDIPGAELDDKQEKIGSEDEENNHYSLGGDNHHNLEEDKD